MSLEKEKVSTAVNGLFKLAEKLKEKSLLDDVEVMQLQISVAKVPPKEKEFKLKLPHGLKHEKTEVCLFVKDLDGGKDREHEPTKRHFEEMMSKHNISCVSEIIPLKALKLEYKPFEAKRNLSNAFDMFLADARIIRLLPTYLGKHFYGRKKAPVQVDLEAKKLKEEVDAALNNSRCCISNKGSSSIAVIANLEMKESDVVENIISSVSQIGDSVPGGWTNVKQLSIKTNTSPSIPIYISSVVPQNVTIPREAAPEKVEAEEITTVFGAKVKVYPNGVVKVIRDGHEDDDDVPKKKRRFTKKKRSNKKIGSKKVKSKKVDSETVDSKEVDSETVESKKVKSMKVESNTESLVESVTKPSTKADTPSKSATKVTRSAKKAKISTPSSAKSTPKSSANSTPKSSTKSTPKSSAKSTPKSSAKSDTKTAVKTPVRASKRKLVST